MRRPFVLAVFAALLAAPIASAYEEPIKTSYTRTSPNGAYVFVMLVPPGLRPSGSPPDELAKKYPQSGMYRNDGNSSPVWVFSDGYARDAFPASDGRHVATVAEHHILFNRRTCGNSPVEPPPNPVVLKFYMDGNKVRDMRLGDVLDHVAFAKERGPGWHVWMHSASIDEVEGVIVVETVAGARRLSLTTGRPINAAVGDEAATGDQVTSPGGAPFGLLLGIGLAAVAVLGTVTVVVVLLGSARV